MVNLFVNLRTGAKVLSNKGEITTIQELKDGYIPTLVLDSAMSDPYPTWVCLTVKDNGDVDKLVGRFNYWEDTDEWYTDTLEWDERIIVWEYLADNSLIKIESCDTIKSMKLITGAKK